MNKQLKLDIQDLDRIVSRQEAAAFMRQLLSWIRSGKIREQAARARAELLKEAKDGRSSAA